MKEQITYDIFDKVDIRVGTVISVKKNEKARKPSLVIKVDFGDDIETTDIDRDGQQKATGITHEVWRLALDASLRWTPQCVGVADEPAAKKVSNTFSENAAKSKNLAEDRLERLVQIRNKK